MVKESSWEAHEDIIGQVRCSLTILSPIHINKVGLKKELKRTLYTKQYIRICYLLHLAHWRILAVFIVELDGVLDPNYSSQSEEVRP